MADRLSQILEGADAIPALPGVVTRAISMLGGDAADLDEVAEIVQQDEALSVAILRLGNSARFGAPGATFDLKQSMVRIGAKELLRVIVGRQCSGLFDSAGSSYGLRRHAMWRSAIGGAVASELLAQETGYEAPEQAYLCGLLRDVGKLAIDAHVAASGASLDEMLEGGCEPVVDAEHKLFGADHAEIGAMLVEKWGLPERIANVIRRSHDPAPPGDERHDTLTDLVHAGDTVCLWADLGIGDDGLRYRLADHARERYLPDRNAVDRLTPTLWARVQDIEQTLGLTAEGNAA